MKTSSPPDTGAAPRLPGRTSETRPVCASPPPPGSAPGIESFDNLDSLPGAEAVRIHCMDYGPGRVESRDITDLDAFLSEPRPPGCGVRWINIEHLHPRVVDVFRRRFDVHTLAAEDVLRTSQRPKLETYDNHLFIVVRMLRLVDGSLMEEQVSLFLFADTLVTLHERPGDVWDPIRARIRKDGSRLRNLDASYLLYALLDAVVDHCFPILEHYGDELEAIEAEVIEHPTPRAQQHLHRIKRELARLRRDLWPLREVIHQLQLDETGAITPAVKAYMRDVYDHAVQVMDIVETFREMGGAINDLYMSAMSHRMNEIMKVLTIMASFFIPITFVAGVYGMNFNHMPELNWKFSYAVFWLICLAIAGGLAFFFWRKGWIGRR